tara:strand:- start:38236 stop:40449 length:2214 start_codon:yes stop_codon:yes gene_type:complete
MQSATRLTVPVLLAFVQAAHAAPPVEDLLRDVAAIQSGGNPASLVAWDRAEPLVVAPDGTIFAAATEIGSGRVVAVGHAGFISTENADSEILAANVIAWLGEGRSKAGPIRVLGLPDPVAEELKRRGTPFLRVQSRPAEARLDSIDVIVSSPQAFANAGRFDELRDWLHAGGSMLVTETAWGNLQLNPGLTLDELAANRLLTEAGIRFTGDANSAYGADADYPIDRALLGPANANSALAVLAGDQSGDTVFAARIVGNAFGAVPLDTSIIRDARSMAEQRRDELDAIYGGMTTQRVTAQRHPLARALLDLDSRMAAETPPRAVKAHPSSLAFPGPVGPDRAGPVTLQINPRVPGWHTTGLYAPPGELITVTLLDQARAADAITLQIGAWRDPHTHPHRVRLRDAIRRFPITDETTEAASAIGGPIYLDLSTTFAAAPHHGPLTVVIDGAARAPHYKHGLTDPAAWRDSIRHLDAPWAEFESDNLIFTVPSDAIRGVEDPASVMDHWDKVHDAMQSLEPRTPNHWADRPYRYVADVSVSWGYMYCPSDGPIVIPTSAAADMFDPANFDAEGENKLWGHYHEMGHAHQNPLWTDRATGEVTVNIFTVYALHTVNGFPLDHPATRSTPENARRVYEIQQERGKPFDQIGGPFDLLQFYAILWHHFGFDPFHAAFDTIRALPAQARPKDTDAERNTFLVHMSRAVGHDLSDYFRTWGIAVSEDAAATIADLPAWMPPEPGS